MSVKGIPIVEACLGRVYPRKFPLVEIVPNNLPFAVCPFRPTAGLGTGVREACNGPYQSSRPEG